MTEVKVKMITKDDMEIEFPCGHIGKFSDTECKQCLKEKSGEIVETKSMEMNVQGLRTNEAMIININKKLQSYKNVIKTSVTKCEGELAISVQDLVKKTTVVIKSSEQLLQDFNDGLKLLTNEVLEKINKMKKLSLYKLCTNSTYRDNWYDYAKKALKLGFGYSVIRARNKLLAFLGISGAGISVGTLAFSVVNWCK